MVLRVPFSEFAPAVKRLLPTLDAFLEEAPTHVRLTAGATTGTLVVCLTDRSASEARKLLEAEGMVVHVGAWGLSEPTTVDACDDLYVASISYLAKDDRPGLWVDAYPFEPTPIQALRAMYEEFRANGEVAEVAFDDFVKMSGANVLITGMHQLSEWARTHRPSGDDSDEV